MGVSWKVSSRGEKCPRIGTNHSGCPVKNRICRDKSGSRENSEEMIAMTQGDVCVGGED